MKMRIVEISPPPNFQAAAPASAPLKRSFISYPPVRSFTETKSFTITMFDFDSATSVPWVLEFISGPREAGSDIFLDLI
jgi:hypothetical protein